MSELSIILSISLLLITVIRASGFYFFVTALFVFLVNFHLFYLQVTGYYRFYEPNHINVTLLLFINFILCLIIFYFGGFKKISGKRLYIPRDMRVMPSFFPIFFVLYLILLMYIVFTVSTINDKSFDVFSRENNPTYEYFGLIFLLCLISRKKLYINPFNAFKLDLVKWILFVSSLAGCYTLLLSGMRLAALQILLSYILMFNFMRFDKKSVITVSVIAFLLLNILGSMRFGASFSFENALSMKSSFGVLDNTFMGVIESGYMLNRFEFEKSYLPIINSLVYTHWPFINSLLPDIIGFKGIANDYIRFPGGGYLAHFILNTGGFLYISIIFLYRCICRVEGSSEINTSPFQYTIYWCGLITIPRFLLYSPAITFKYIFICLVLLTIHSYLVKITK